MRKWTDTIITDEENIWKDRNVLLSMDIDNSMERACDKWENSQEYRNYK